MLNLDDPRLAALLKYPPAPAPVLVDYLQENQADLATMAALFAGTPPSHQNGISQEALALWLEREGQGEQAGLIREHRVEWGRENTTGDEWWGVHFANPTGSFGYDPFSDPDVARRALKRRILSLPWAEGVRVGRLAEVPCARVRDLSGSTASGRPCRSYEFMNADLDAAGIRWDLDHEVLFYDGTSRIARVRQVLTAPQLIWPEPQRGHVPGAALNPNAFREHIEALDQAIMQGLGVPAHLTRP